MKPTNYSCPPAKKIAAAFKCDIATAKKARALMKGQVTTIGNPDFPKTTAWVCSCYNEPSRISRILSALNELLECHGVEALRSRESGMYAAAVEWLNTGDAYSPTLLFRHDTGTFKVTTWGGFFEANEKRMGLYSF